MGSRGIVKYQLLLRNLREITWILYDCFLTFKMGIIIVLIYKDFWI